MPRKRVVRSPPSEKRSDDDEDYFFDDSLSGSGRSSQEPQHRNAANARERARMRVLSKAFCRLKTTLPWVPADTKLSKLDTLRLAASYIAHLKAILHDEPRTAAEMFPHPLNLAWPFAFQHGGAITNSPRWNSSTPSQPGQCDELATHQGTETEDTYRQYSDNDYDDRNYKHSNQQYCENEYFLYKDASYEPRSYITNLSNSVID